MARGEDFLARLAEDEGDEQAAAAHMAEGAVYRSTAAKYSRKAASLQAEVRAARRHEPAPGMSPHRVSRSREVRRRSVRSGPRRTRAPASRADDDPPLPDLTRLARASARMWTRVRRREAKQRVAWA
jgi:hypothetical protein